MFYCGCYYSADQEAVVIALCGGVWIMVFGWIEAVLGWLQAVVGAFECYGSLFGG
ncbi:MAG: hypothetical protein QG599_1967 [Pseudomonadota bacterium]|nr:hypothetical protein [Pseudomonadota bacterium]